jgi:DNA polymerase I-like protein with 3'-5' exonuclease and polymerase domains
MTKQRKPSLIERLTRPLVVATGLCGLLPGCVIKLDTGQEKVQTIEIGKIPGVPDNDRYWRTLPNYDSQEKIKALNDPEKLKQYQDSKYILDLLTEDERTGLTNEQTYQLMFAGYLLNPQESALALEYCRNSKNQDEPLADNLLSYAISQNNFTQEELKRKSSEYSEVLEAGINYQLGRNLETVLSGIGIKCLDE